MLLETIFFFQIRGMLNFMQLYHRRKKSILLYDDFFQYKKEFLFLIFPNQIVACPGVLITVSSDSQFLRLPFPAAAECGDLVFSLLLSWLPPEKDPFAIGQVLLARTPTQRLA